MLWDDAKKNAMTIVGRRNKKGERTAMPTPMKAEETNTADGATDGRHLAAQDMLSAMNEGSAQKYSEALGNYLDMHMAQGDKPTGPS
jgi:hypothetical protein